MSHGNSTARVKRNDEVVRLVDSLPVVDNVGNPFKIVKGEHLPIATYYVRIVDRHVASHGVYGGREDQCEDNTKGDEDCGGNRPRAAMETEIPNKSVSGDKRWFWLEEDDKKRSKSNRVLGHPHSDIVPERPPRQER